ncbi:MAG: hypothetical protein JST68_17160 [Bacteroidetes bacterium]|nr:hypothetical protein [Bacteroidota bacterium]
MSNWPLKIAIPLVLFCACESPSDKILKEFKRVNASIEKSTQTVLEQNDFTLAFADITKKTIDSPNKHPGWNLKAGKLFGDIEMAKIMIDSLKTSYNEEINEKLRMMETYVVEDIYAAIPPDADKKKEQVIGFLITPVKSSTLPGFWKRQDSTMLDSFDKSSREAATLVFKEMSAKF